MQTIPGFPNSPRVLTLITCHSAPPFVEQEAISWKMAFSLPPALARSLEAEKADITPFHRSLWTEANAGSDVLLEVRRMDRFSQDRSGDMAARGNGVFVFAISTRPQTRPFPSRMHRAPAGKAGPAARRSTVSGANCLATVDRGVLPLPACSLSLRVLFL